MYRYRSLVVGRARERERKRERDRDRKTDRERDRGRDKSLDKPSSSFYSRTGQCCGLAFHRQRERLALSLSRWPHNNHIVSRPLPARRDETRQDKTDRHVMLPDKDGHVQSKKRIFPYDKPTVFSCGDGDGRPAPAEHTTHNEPRRLRRYSELGRPGGLPPALAPSFLPSNPERPLLSCTTTTTTSRPKGRRQLFRSNNLQTPATTARAWLRRLTRHQQRHPLTDRIPRRLSRTAQP